MRKGRIKILELFCEHFFLALDSGDIKLGGHEEWRIGETLSKTQTTKEHLSKK